MMVKTFHGRTCSDALNNVRLSLGPDAAILETRQGDMGIEVVAALARPEPAPCFQPASSSPESMSASHAPTGTLVREEDWVEDFLVMRGFSYFLANRVASAVRANLDPEQQDDRERVLDYARTLLELWLKVPASAAQRTGVETCVLVGPSGVGKTTTVAKMAAREMVHADRRVVIASTDDRRLGGAEQMEAFARVLGAPFQSVNSQRELEKARVAAGKDGIVFLDTPGVPRGDRRAMDRLADIVTRVTPDEITLLLAADRDAATLADAVHRFRPLRPGRSSATRTDETVRPGALVSALVRSRLPIVDITNGPDVPDDIEAADSRRLAAWALSSPEERA